MPGTNPWEKRKWHGGRIRPSSAGALILLALGAVFLSVGILAAIKVPNALKLPPSKDTIVLLFPFVGLCITALAIFMFLRTRKWRGSQFIMQTIPGVIGGRLTGVLVVSGPIGPDADIDIMLVNEEHRTRKSGKRSSTSVSCLFKHEIQVNSATASHAVHGYALPGIDQLEIPFDVEIPYEAKDSTDDHKSGSTKYAYKWKLKVTADIPGMDLCLEFPIPVYRTDDSDPAICQTKPDSVNAAAAVAAHKAGQLDFVDIKTDQIAGVEHYISKGKSRLLLIISFVILAVGIGIACSSISGFIPKYRDSHGLVDKLFTLATLLGPMIISCGFLLVGSVCAVASVFMMGTRDIWVADGKIHYTKRLGQKKWSQTIGADYIIDIAVEKCGATNDNNFYAVRLEHSDLSQVSKFQQFMYNKAAQKKGFAQVKVPLEIARDIDDKAQAHLLAEKIKQQLGLITTD